MEKTANRLKAGDQIKCKSIKDIAREENHLIKEGYEFRVSFKNLTVQITKVPEGGGRMNAVDFFRRGRMNAVDFLRERGYPKKILGKGGNTAVLVGIQPLVDGDFAAIYRHRGGECVIDLETVQKFEVVER